MLALMSLSRYTSLLGWHIVSWKLVEATLLLTKASLSTGWSLAVVILECLISPHAPLLLPVTRHVGLEIVPASTTTVPLELSHTPLAWVSSSVVVHVPLAHTVHALVHVLLLVHESLLSPHLLLM